MLRVEPAEVGRASDEDVSLEILMDFCSDFRGFLANISQFFDMFLKFKVSKVFEKVKHVLEEISGDLEAALKAF